MPDPTGYALAYSFSGFQSSNPQSPLPAVSLDVELEAVAEAIASTNAALADIRRSDGGIKNGSVTTEALDDGLRALFGVGGGAVEGVLADQLDPSAFANQVQAQGGISNDRVMTPLRTKQAMDALRAFASEAAAAAATADDVVLSPATAKHMLDTLRAFCDQTEVEGGTVSDKVTSPLTVKMAIDRWRKILRATQSLVWAEIAGGASQTQTVTVTGAQQGDRVLAGLPGAGIEDGLLWTAWISATHTLSVRLRNLTASPLTPATGAWEFTVIRF